MNKFLKKLQESIKDWDPVEFIGLSDALIYVVETPAHRFTSVIATVNDEDVYVHVCGRDFFSEKLAATTLQFVRDHSAMLEPKDELKILPGFRCAGFKFDSVGVLGVSASDFDLDDNLVGKVRTAFPMYRCELSGNENAKLLDAIRHEGLCTIDWKRTPEPKLSAEFHNSTSQSSRFGLCSYDLASRVVENMVGDDGSWLKLQNYLGEFVTIRWSNGKFEVVDERHSYECDHEKLVADLKTFAFGKEDKKR